MEPNILSSGYDAVFAATPKSPTLRRLWSQHAAGTDFPEEFLHISFVTLSQLRRITEELRLAPNMTFVDLACGMGGPALWVARQTGASLIGVDFSPVAIGLATTRAEGLGLSGQARFTVGSFDATGLPDQSVDAAMSEDALQYAPSKSAAFVEAARILRRGGRLVFTAFELDAATATGLPVLGEDVVGDFRPLLTDAGFQVDAYEEAPGCPEPLRSTYQALLDAREALIGEMGDVAAAALFTELTMTLEREPYRRRVLACATKT